jgi:lipocalin
MVDDSLIPSEDLVKILFSGIDLIDELKKEFSIETIIEFVFETIKTLSKTKLFDPIDGYYNEILSKFKDIDITNLVNVLVSLSQIPHVSPVDNIDWDKYLGEWEQVYAGPFSVIVIEQAGVDNKALYKKIKEDTISVTNSQKTILGKSKVVQGKGVITDPSIGKLKLTFDQNPNRTSNYWVVALDDDPKNKTYQWAVVTDPYRLNLFVLARNRQEFQDKYYTEVKAVLEALGFSYFFNIPVTTE